MASRETQIDRGIIRRARQGEGSELTALARRSKGLWGYDESFLSACEKELTVSDVELAHNPAYVIDDSGRIVGFYMLQPLTISEVELTFLFVEPDEIGRGYGGRLLRHAVSTASNLEFRTMLIQGDPHADGFYRAMGARKIGTRSSESIPGRELPLYNIDLTVQEAASVPRASRRGEWQATADAVEVSNTRAQCFAEEASAQMG